MKTKHIQDKKDSFFMFFRKRGVMDALSILMEQPFFTMTQKAFFQAFGSKNRYPNLFFRVKSSLLQKTLIGFRLNPQNQKVLFLTEKGIRFMEIILQIESMFSELTPDDNIKEPETTIFSSLN